MNCPRCDRPLSRYALSGSDNSAVVCESCGFVGVSTSHRVDRVQPESWDAVVNRIETDLKTLDFGQQHRTEGQQLPGSSAASDSTLDGQRLEEKVSVGVALADRDRAADPDAVPDPDTRGPNEEPPSAEHRNRAATDDGEQPAETTGTSDTRADAETDTDTGPDATGDS